MVSFSLVWDQRDIICIKCTYFRGLDWGVMKNYIEQMDYDVRILQVLFQLKDKWKEWHSEATIEL